MNSSIPSTTCSSPNNDSVEKVVKNDAVRYKRKGYGLVTATLLTLSFFFLTPYVLKMIWPTFETKREEEIFVFVSSLAIHNGVYLIANTIMYFIYTMKLPFFERYRILNKPWPWEENPEKWRQTLRKTIKCTLIAHFLLVPPFLLNEIFMGLKVRMDAESLPSHSEFISQIIFFMIIEDFSFYWSHRLLHSKKLYSLIHKIHHEYSVTISIAAEYSHPLEFVLSNLIPTNLGRLILGSRVHYATSSIWIIMRIMETVDGHSGYEFSWSPYRLLPLSSSSMYHNFHHSNNVGNFASFFTYWDTLCGTNKAFYRHLAKKEKEVLLAEMRSEFSKLQAKMESDPAHKLAKLQELNPQFNPNQIPISGLEKLD